MQWKLGCVFESLFLMRLCFDESQGPGILREESIYIIFSCQTNLRRSETQTEKLPSSDSYMAACRTNFSYDIIRTFFSPVKQFH